mmetsp:Transcript_56415/g.148789  ORF Transcript_56415/g.148789 Transcript_56415/m.148789 type:complete len:120 (-) Transcript_56415:96-455(-)
MSSAMGGASANQQNKVRPPDKGSFPLDHFNDCKTLMQNYLACMKEHQNSHALCREQTTAYLQCRMQKGLMAEEKISNFGLDTPIDFEASKKAQEEYINRQYKKREDGFVAGLTRAQHRT